MATPVRVPKMLRAAASAPLPRQPALWFAGGTLGFAIASVWTALVLARGDWTQAFQASWLGAAHAWATGGVLSVLFGVWRQMNAVMFRRPLPGSFAVHAVLFAAHMLGAWGVASHMALGRWNAGLWSAAILLALSVLTHNVLFARALLSVRMASLTSRAFLAAQVCLASGALLGAYLAVNLAHPRFNWDHIPWLKAHLLFMIGGAVLLPLCGALPHFLAHLLGAPHVPRAGLRFAFLCALAAPFLQLTVAALRLQGVFTWIPWAVEAGAALGILTYPLLALTRRQQPFSAPAATLCLGLSMLVPAGLCAVLNARRAHGLDASAIALGYCVLVGVAATCMQGALMHIVSFMGKLRGAALATRLANLRWAVPALHLCAHAGIVMGLLTGNRPLARAGGLFLCAATFSWIGLQVRGIVGLMKATAPAMCRPGEAEPR